MYVPQAKHSQSPTYLLQVFHERHLRVGPPPDHRRMDPTYYSERQANICPSLAKPLD
jgi:hypothetical protein